MSSCIVYIAMSEDGFIADERGNVDWLPHPDDPNDTLGYQKLIAQIDTIVMGRKSYEQICTFGDWAWKDKSTYVFSHHHIDKIDPAIVQYQKSPLEFMSECERMIWLLGGAELIHSFAQQNLIHQYIITMIPNVFLRNGIFLQLPQYPPTEIHKNCAGDLVQYIYNIY